MEKLHGKFALKVYYKVILCMVHLLFVMTVNHL